MTTNDTNASCDLDCRVLDCDRNCVELDAMSWEYATDRALLWRGKCEDMIADLAPGMVDMLCTDPPWGVGFVSGKAPRPILGDAVGEYSCIPALVSVARLCGSTAHAYVIGPFEDLPAPFGHGSRLIWDKGQTGLGDLTSPWGEQTEPIWFSVIDNRGPSLREKEGRLSARRRQGNVLRVQKPCGPRTKRHPTEKPVALWRMLVEASSLVGETVCDPYMGVGGCGVAAVLAGRTFIGAELDSRFFDIAAKRIEAAEALASAAGAL